MRGVKWRSALGICVAVLIVAFTASPQFRAIYGLPPHLRLMQGEAASFDVNYPLTVAVSQAVHPSVRLASLRSGDFFSRPVFLESSGVGRAVVEFKLLGILPLRTVQVDVMPPLKVVPGGHSIGVMLHASGVLVVGVSPVLSAADGRTVTPAQDAGVRVGDVILRANGAALKSDVQLAEAVDAGGKAHEDVRLVVKRDGGEMEFAVKPVLCAETKRYRIGLFVRDSAAGVGTLTFYDPKGRTYGALGHVITDSDTNQPIDCETGRIVPATVSGIQQGRRGLPGEKIGVFIEEDQLLGNIQKNTQFGIYGTLNGALDNALYARPIPVASMQQVEAGPAEMLTVVEGQTIERFAIQIEKVNLQEYPAGKGLVIKVTDKRLLDRTGGIVQGMSGSPIIQNGKLVGAVTHVFVNDPTKGYGCFIEWMLMDDGMIPQKEKQAAKNLFTRAASMKAA